MASDSLIVAAAAPVVAPCCCLVAAAASFAALFASDAIAAENWHVLRARSPAQLGTNLLYSNIIESIRSQIIGIILTDGRY